HSSSPLSPPPPCSTLFPYTTLFRSALRHAAVPVPGDTAAHRFVPHPRHPGWHGLDAPLPPRGLRGGAVAARERRHATRPHARDRSEEHTSELQSRSDLVCRLLLDKK